MMHRQSVWPHLKRGLVAILRGIRPDEIEAAVDGLIEAGFEAIEVPLNSPDPFRSIERAVVNAHGSALVGAGTVLTCEQVDRLADLGAALVVSPNTAPDVIRRTVERGMVSLPGVFTATEALAAHDAGASALKFFPASVLGPAGIKAIAAILPADAVLAAVGGVADDSFADYAAVRVRTFGLGSSLYKPGMTLDELRANAANAIAAYDRAFAIES